MLPLSSPYPLPSSRLSSLQFTERFRLSDELATALSSGTLYKEGQGNVMAALPPTPQFLDAGNKCDLQLDELK